jgi:hypothetical protein
VQWKLQVLQRTSRHVAQIIHLPPLWTNLSALVPMALCFVAFQYGGDVMTRLAQATTWWDKMTIRKQQWQQSNVLEENIL